MPFSVCFVWFLSELMMTLVFVWSTILKLAQAGKQAPISAATKAQFVYIFWAL